MPKKIDWQYERKHCTTCEKARDYLAGIACTVVAREDAAKSRKGPAAALATLDGMTKLIAVRGLKVYRIDLKKERPSDEELLALIMGPTGNLRGPTVRVGKTMIVGFRPEIYGELIG